MVPGQLSNLERETLEAIIRDLTKISGLDIIKLDEIEDLDLKSAEVSQYLRDLRAGAEPESALREELLAGQSILGRHLFKDKAPEVKIVHGAGIIDYSTIEDDRPILVELKPLFRAHKIRGDIKELRRESLSWQDHKPQIKNYLREKEYLIFTNLSQWVFFSRRSTSPINSEPLSLLEFHEEFRTIESLRGYLERLESRYTRSDLDQEFFESLKSWVDQLGQIKFEDAVTDEEKNQAIIKLLNKFIFIQTLDDHFVVRFNWISRRWRQKQDDWKRLSTRKMLREFLDEVDDWFYSYYDTELFKDNILGIVHDDEDNLEEFWRCLKRILGLEYWQGAVGPRGITNFNFRQIDEDVLGKAYETFLASQRREEGIFYTGKHVTAYIVRTVLEEQIDPLLKEFQKALEEDNIERTAAILDEILSIRVLDPACGSGSFLIKAVRMLWEKYQWIDGLLLEKRASLGAGAGQVTLVGRNMDELGVLEALRTRLGGSDRRTLISKLLLRHIHGIDKDENAISVAKVNIWLETVKLIPDHFRYTNIEGRGYILPDLEMNLAVGDSLVGLPVDETLARIEDGYIDEVKALAGLRARYLEDPTDEEVVDEYLERQAAMRSEFHEHFRDHLTNELGEELVSVIDETPPLHFAAHFWFAYYDEEGNRLTNPGFHCVCGNPPYVSGNTRRRSYSDEMNDYWKAVWKPSASGNFDIYLPFLQLALERARSGGSVSFIVPNKHLAIPYAEKYRRYLLDNGIYFHRLANVSQLDLFEEADVYPVIPAYTKSAPPEGAVVSVYTPATAEDLGNREPSYQHDYECLDDLPEVIWSFLLLDDASLFWDVQSRCVQLGHGRNTVQASSTAREADSFTVAISNDAPGENLKRFIKTGGIDPLLSKWGLEPVRHQRDSYRNPVLDNDHPVIPASRRAQYDSEKLIFAKVATTIEAMVDFKGEYASADTNFLLNPDADIGYYGGIVNNYAANYMYAGLFGALRMAGGDLQFQAPQLRLLPVPGPDDVAEGVVDEIAELARRLSDLRRFSHAHWKIWEGKSEALKSEDRPLSAILLKDKQEIQDGHREKAWTDNVPFFPDADREVLDEEFGTFEIEADAEDPLLTVYGIAGRERKELFRMKFRDGELRDHVYLAIQSTLHSKKDVRCLRELLEKTDVPIVKPGYHERTQRIIKEAYRQVKNEVFPEHSTEDPTLPIASLEQRAMQLAVRLEALAFVAYGFESDQARTVMEYLEVPKPTEERVVRELDSL